MIRRSGTSLRNGLPTSYGSSGPYADASSAGEYGFGAGYEYGSTNGGGGALGVGTGGASSSYGGYTGGRDGYGSDGNAGGGSSSGIGYGNSPYGGYHHPGNDKASFSSNVSNSSTYSRRYNQQASPVTQLLNRLKDPHTWPLITSLLFGYLTLSYRSKYNAVLQFMNVKRGGGLKEAKSAWETAILTRDSKQRQIVSMHEQQKKNSQRLTDCENEKRKALKERDELRVKYESPEKMNAARMVASREKAWKEQVQLLQLATQRESRRSAVEKFGKGPHYVEFTVEITSLPESEAMKTFTIEMAPLDYMPHAVHLFLEQVDHKLWDNSWFYINGPHVLQAGPQVDEEELDAVRLHDHEIDERSIALRPFRLKNLDSLAFPEYSEDYPHLPWTLGFTGRPGGPDFYINKMDNSETHGPGGQQNHDLAEFADACFARVYSGFDTITAIIAAPTSLNDPLYKYFYDDPIHINRVVILPSAPIQSHRDILMTNLSRSTLSNGKSGSIEHVNVIDVSRQAVSENVSSVIGMLPQQPKILPETKGQQIQYQQENHHRFHKKPKHPFVKPDFSIDP